MSSSTSSCSTADFTVFPTNGDIACAVGSVNGIPSNTSSVFDSCCKSASVEQFNGECGLYCLAVEQTVADLQKCFMDGGVLPGSILCNGNNTATATGKGSSSGSPTSSGNRGSASATESTGAAASMLAPQSLNKAGLGVLGMLVVSAFAGALL